MTSPTKRHQSSRVSKPRPHPKPDEGALEEQDHGGPLLERARRGKRYSCHPRRRSASHSRRTRHSLSTLGGQSPAYAGNGPIGPLDAVLWLVRLTSGGVGRQCLAGRTPNAGRTQHETERLAAQGSSRVAPGDGKGPSSSTTGPIELVHPWPSPCPSADPQIMQSRRQVSATAAHDVHSCSHNPDMRPAPALKVRAMAGHRMAPAPTSSPPCCLDDSSTTAAHCAGDESTSTYGKKSTLPHDVHTLT